MANIKKTWWVPVLRHCQGEAHTYLIVTKGGKEVKRGRGLGFWFGPVGTAVSEVPVNDQSVPVAFNSRSQDFQEVSISGQVWYTVTEPEGIARRFDFSLDTTTGAYNADPLTVIQAAIVSAAQEAVWSYVAARTLEDLLSAELSGLSGAVSEALATLDFGVNVTRAVVTEVRPEPRLREALMAKTRERLQMEADAAGFERRAKATEQERAISEAELANQLALAKRREALIAQNDANARAEAQSSAALEKIRMETQVDNAKLQAEERLRDQKAQDAVLLDKKQKLADLVVSELDRTLQLYADQPAASRLHAVARAPESLKNLQVLTVGEGGLTSALERIAGERS